MTARLRHWARKRATGSMCAWHGSQDLCATLLAPVGHVIDLPAWEQDAHLHGLAASGALRRMGRKRDWVLLWSHEPRSDHSLRRFGVLQGSAAGARVARLSPQFAFSPGKAIVVGLNFLNLIGFGQSRSQDNHS
jgi:hypothetical protein